MADVERESKETRVRCGVRRGTGQAKVVFEGVLAGSEPGEGQAAAEGRGAVLAGSEPGEGQAAAEGRGAVFPASEPGEGEAASGGRAAFAKHMIETLAKWSGYDIDLHVVAKDHLEHHAIEDGAIALGKALRGSIDTGAIERMAHVVVPMDDALVLVALDLVERPYYEGPLPDPLLDHVLRSLATEGGFTLHVVPLRGRDPHHVVEAAFKGLALCLDRATRPRAERLSTKGAVEYREGA